MKAKQLYLEAKKITEIAVDPSHPMNEFVRDSLSVADLYNLHKMIKEMEDQGVHLLGEVN